VSGLVTCHVTGVLLSYEYIVKHHMFRRPVGYIVKGLTFITV